MLRRSIVVALATVLVLAGSAAVASAAPSILPSHLTAGSATAVSLHVPGCTSQDVQLIGSVLSGGSASLKAAGSGHFTGRLKVVAGASGKHALSVRCGGGNAGSVTVNLGGDSGRSRAGTGTGAPRTAPGTQTLRIGWVYTDEEYTGTHADRLVILWRGCIAAGGFYVDFPDGSHVYKFRGPPGPQRARLLLFNRQFVGQPYVGASAPEGERTITLSCLTYKKRLLATGRLHVKFVHDPLHFGANDIPQTLTLPPLHAGVATLPNQGPLITACSEPGIRTVTLTSQALAPNADGQRAVTLSRSLATFEDPQFQGPITGATDVAPGSYPVTVACGSGVVGSGTITLQPPL